MAEDKIKNLYDTFVSEGYDMESEEDFRNNLADATKRRNAYDALVADGYEMEGYESFEKNIGFPTSPSQPKVEAPATPQSPVEQIATEQGWGKSAMPTDELPSAPHPNSTIAQVRNEEKAEEQAKIDAMATPITDKVVAGMQGNATPSQQAYQKKLDDIDLNLKMGAITPQEADVQRRSQEIGSNLSVANRPSDEQMRRVNAEQVSELTKTVDALMEKRGKELDRTIPYAVAQSSIGAIPNLDRGRLTDTEFSTLVAAKRALSDAQSIIDEADRHINPEEYSAWQKNWVNGLGRGIGDGLFDVRTWDMGINEMSDASVLYQALDKADKGEELTEAEEALLDAKALEMATNAYFGSHLGRAYKAGQVTAQSVPFMLEMAINPLSAVGKTAQNKLVRWALKKYGKGLVEKKLKYGALKYGTRLAGDLVGSAGMTLTTSLPTTIADTYSRMSGDVMPTYDDGGVASYGGHEGGVSAGKAIYQSIMAGTLERFSEMMGYYFAPMLKAAGKPVSKMMDAPRLAKVNDFLGKVSATDLARGMRDFQRNTRWDGVFGEYLEEVANNHLNALLVGDMEFNAGDKGVYNLDTNIDTFLGVSVLGGGMSAIKTAYYPVYKYRQQRVLTNADRYAGRAFGSDWEGIKSQLTKIDDSIKQPIADILQNEDYTPEQKRAALQYVKAKGRLKGMQDAEIRKYTDPEMPTEQKQIAASYDVGRSLHTPEEMNEAKLDMEDAANALREHFALGENADVDAFLGDNAINDIINSMEMGGSVEEAQLKLDYLNAKATYDGMLDEVKDNVRDEVGESNRLIDSRVNKDTGRIQTAKIGAENDLRDVFIVGGNVELLDGGEYIDREKSSKDVIVMDAVTGKLEMTTSDQLRKVKPSLDVNEVKTQAANEIKVRKITEASNNIDGTLLFAVGDVYTIADNDGAVHQATVMLNNGDGTAMVSIDGAEAKQVMTADIQAMADAYKGIQRAERKAQAEQAERDTFAEVEQEAQEKEAQAQQEAEKETIPATSSIPVDENGNRQYTQVDADTAWDALMEQTEGDTEMAMDVANAMTQKAEKALEDVKKEKVADGNTPEEMIAAKKAHKDKVAQAQAEVDKWNAIASTPQRRAEKAETEARAEAMQERINKAAEANAQKTATYQLSEEVDENGRQFVLSSNGDITFGNIEEESGLTPAPILLSEGIITNPATNDGYGLVHIEARHGDQIRKAGYPSVVAFVEEVAKNYEVIKEGKDRKGVSTYMLQLTDKHNNTLMVELSGDGTYWNINTAGIFKTSYGKNRKEVYNRQTTAKQPAETVETSQSVELNGTQTPPSLIDVSTPIASESKDTTSEPKNQEATQEISASQKNLEQKMRMSNARAVQQKEGHFYKEDAELGAPIDFRDYVMRAIARGGVKFIWGNNPRTGTRGLAAHTGFKEEERRKRIGILSNEGMYPEVAAERLLASYADEIGYDPRIDTMDALGEIIDVVMSYTTPKEMMQAAQQRHQESEEKLAQQEADFYEGEYYKQKAAERGMSVAEYLLEEEMYEEVIAEELIERDKVKEEIDAIFVELYFDEYENERRNQSLHQGVSGQTRNGADNEGGSNVLPTAGSNQPTAIQRSAERQGADAQVGNEGNNDISPRQAQREPGGITEVTPQQKAANKHAKALVKRINEWAKALKVEAVIYSSVDEVESTQARENLKKGANITGWYKNGKVYFYLPNLSDVSDVNKTFIHETVAHHGLRALLGEEGYRDLCGLVYDEVMTDEQKAHYLDYVRKYEPVEGGATEGKATYEEKIATGDEYMAFLAENTYVEYSSAFDKVASLVRKALRAIGFDVKLSGAELRDLLRQSYKNLESGKAQATTGEHRARISSTETNPYLGRSLTSQESKAVIALMENNAQSAPELELTPENWVAEFGEDGIVPTPIGDVKMGENQYFKMAQKGREGKLGMIKPTLKTPDVIVEEESKAKDGKAERNSSFVFVKAFTNEDGTRNYLFTSVTIRKEGKEVVISNQEKETPRIERLLKEGKLAYINEATLPSESTNSTQGNQSTILGGAILSESKDTTTKPQMQEVAQENVEATEKNIEEVAESANRIEEEGGQVDVERGDVRFAVRDVLIGEKKEQAIKDIMRVTGRSRKTVLKYLKAEESLANIILNDDNEQFLDLQVDESVPSIWKNSDYPQGTVEFSNICRKRLPFTMIYQQLQKDYPNTVFDASTLETIRATLKDNGIEVACGLCFVEDRRQLLGEIAQGFIEALQGKDVELNKKQRDALSALRRKGDNYIPSLYELLTLDGMRKLRRMHPDVATAFIRYNNARGMQAGRLFQAYSAYHREILDFDQKRVDKINNNGGLRIFSFSDFEAHHLIDLVQVLTDCATKGIKVQGYTKVPEFARAVKDTKMKLNRSLIAKDSGIVDADYIPQQGEAVSPNVINGKRLLLDTVEGIDVNHKDFFDSSSSANVGNILVGINDEQIRLAMADPFVDYIIPFHSGLSEAIRKQKGIGEWVNYKLTQLEKKYNANGKLVNADKHGINIYTEVLSDDINTEKQFVEKYLEVCKKKGWIPKFHQFLNKNKAGEFVYTKGYAKLLIDYKMFDKNGRILPQEVVEPIFDNEFNKQILEDYVEGEKAKVPNAEIYEQVKEALQNEGKIRFRIADNYTAEEQEIIAQAKANGTYLKAPNGAGTNLTPKQWVQVRTKAFKEWFGDWEKATRIEKLRKSKNATITGEEIEASEDLKQYRKNAQVYGRTLQGQYTNADTGAVISLQRGRHNGGINEVLQHNYKDVAHLQSVAAIPQIIENGIYIESQPNRDIETNPNVSEYQIFVCGLNIGGEDYTVLAKVAVDKNGNRYYDHNLVSVEKGKLIDIANNNQSAKSSGFGTTPDTKSTTNSQYKFKEIISILQTNSSKIVDANGEPKVVYHQTNATQYINVETGENWDDLDWRAKMEWDERDDWDEYWQAQDFYEFSRANARITNEFDGFFFAPEYDQYHEYGERTIAAFLNIRKPAFRDDYNIDSSKNEAGRDERIRLQGEGYDGVIREFDGVIDEYVAFEPNQIKSATDNVGSFDAGNNDIRFRVAYASRFKDMQREYDALDKSDEMALNAWRDEKADVVRGYLEKMKRVFNLPDDVYVFNGAREEEMQKAYDYFVERLKENGITKIPSFGTFKKKASNEKVRASHRRKAALATFNVGKRDWDNSVGSFFATLFHENTHNLVEGMYSEQELKQIWDEAKEQNHFITREVMEYYADKSDAQKGNEFIAKSIGWLARKHPNQFRAFVKGEGNISVGDVVKRLKYKSRYGNFVVEEILNKFKENYGRKENVQRVGGSILGGSRDGGYTSVSSGYRRSDKHSVGVRGRGDTRRDVRLRRGVITPEQQAFYDTVAKNGLRRVVGKENYDEFLFDVFQQVDNTTRGKIVDLARTNDWNFLNATEQFFASLAENNNAERGFFEKLRDLFVDMLRKVGINIGNDIADNDLLYMLWRTYQMQHSKGAIAVAEDVVMQQKLGVGNFRARVADQFPADTSDSTRFKVIPKEEYAVLSSEIMNRQYVQQKPTFDYAYTANNFYVYDFLEDSSANIIFAVPIVGNEDLIDTIYKSIENGAINSPRSLDTFIEEVQSGERGDIAYNTNALKKYQRNRGIHIRIPSRSSFEAGGVSGVGNNDSTRLTERGAGGETNGSATPNLTGQTRFRIARPSTGEAKDYYNKVVRTPNKSGSVKKSDNLAHRLQEAYQDSMLSVRALMEGIRRETGAPYIKDMADVYTAENRLSSTNKAQIEAWERDFFAPLMEAVIALTQKGVKYEDIVEYIVAKHGLERNLVFSQRDAEKDGGVWDGFVKKDYSGLTELTGEAERFTEAAQQIVDEFEQKYNTQNLWDAINNATKTTLKKSFDSGMMSKETYDNLTTMFKYYVPLRGWANDVAADEYEYIGSSNMKILPTLKTAKGRTSLAEDPLATIGTMGESAIIQGNKNLMKQKLLNLALQYPTSLLSVSEQWYVKQPNGKWIVDSPYIPEGATGEEVAQILADHEKDMEALGSNATKQREGLDIDLHLTRAEGQEHAVRVKRNGKEYVVYVNGNPIAARAINGFTNPNAATPEDWMKTLKEKTETIKNYMARAFTSANPAFVISNLSRDVIWAGTAVAIKENAAYTAQYTKNITREFLKAELPRLVRKWQNGTLDENEPIERFFKEFLLNGGETGFTQLNTVDDYKHTMRRKLKEAQKGSPTQVKKALRGIVNGIEFLNRSAEDTTRFAVYMTSRQMGRSVARSIDDAKNITVNFNKKGRGNMGAAALGYMYIFFNAAVQSIANFGKLVKEHPIKTASWISAYGSAGFLTPIITMAIQSLIGDDDDENSYWNLPEWVRRNNLILPLGANGYVTVPLPHELRPFYALGEIALSVLAGKEDVEDGLRKAVAGFAGMLPVDPTGNAGDMVINLTPTFAQPIMQIARNTDFFGVPIYKDSPFNQNAPEWTKAYKGTSPLLVNGTRWWNEIWGGDAVKSSAIDEKGKKKALGDLTDVNPAIIEHLFESYLGGMGKTYNKLVKTIGMIWNEDLRTMRNVPILSSFVYFPDERNGVGGEVNTLYYDATDEARETERIVSGYKKQVKMGAEEYAEKLDEFLKSPLYQRYKVIRPHRNAVNKLRKELEAKDVTNPDSIEQAIFNVKEMMIKELEELERNGYSVSSEGETPQGEQQ